MDLFDDKGAFKDKVGDYSTSDIPDFLSWDKMGAGILAGVEKRKKKRRLLIWWWGSGISIGCLMIGLCIYLNLPQSNLIEAFPIPVLVENQAVSHEKNKQPNRNELIKNPLKNKQQAASQFSKKGKVAITNNTKLATRKPLVNTWLIDENTRLNKTLESLKAQGQLNQHIDKQIISKQFIAFERIPTLSFFIDLDTIKDLPILSLPMMKKKASKWSLEIASGMNNWQLGTNQMILDAPLQTALKGWQMSFRVDRKITKRLSIKTGIGLQQLRFSSKNTSTKEVLIYQPNTIDTISTSTLTGEQTFTYLDSIPGIESRSFQHFNRYQSLQIPLLLSYQLRHKRWNLAIQTGFSAQLSHRVKGKLAIENGVIIDLLETNIYPNYIRWSHLIETQIGYQIRQNAMVFARFSREQHLRNWHQKDFIYRQKPQILSMEIGINWRLKK